jgi:hypothetical protein
MRDSSDGRGLLGCLAVLQPLTLTDESAMVRTFEGSGELRARLAPHGPYARAAAWQTQLRGDSEAVASIEVDVALLGGLQVAADPVSVTSFEHGPQNSRAKTLTLGGGVGAEHRQIPVRRSVRVPALDPEQRCHDQRHACDQPRVNDAAGKRYVLDGSRLPSLGWRPQRRTREIRVGPDLLVGEQLAKTRRVEELQYPWT